jgi:hypothetical protein
MYRRLSSLRIFRQLKLKQIVMQFESHGSEFSLQAAVSQYKLKLEL